MSLPLPCGDYEFLEDGADEFQALTKYFDEVERSHQEKREPPHWSSHFKDESRGYFIEADVLYPPERHHMMKDYPLARQQLSSKKRIHLPTIAKHGM